jgi:hypothetical protein
MKKRQWTNQQKAQIVLEGLSGQIEIVKLCTKYEIAQTQYYKWRDRYKNLVWNKIKMATTYIKLNRSFAPIPKEVALSEDDYDLGTSWGLTITKKWDDLLNLYRVVILSEAGAGKTEEMRAAANRLRGEGKRAFFLRLEHVGSGVETALDVGTPDDFNGWLSSQEEGWFFLDSVDEARLKGACQFEEAIRKFAYQLGGNIERSHIYITSRVSEWRQKTDLAFIADKFPLKEAKQEQQSEISSTRPNQSSNKNFTNSENNVDPAVFVLCPLDSSQILTFSRELGVSDPDKFLLELKRKEAVVYAKRPGDLTELIAYWKAHGDIANHKIMLEESVSLRLQERDPDHAAVSPLTIEDARCGAEMLAAAVTFQKKNRIFVPDGDAVASEVSINPREVLGKWDSNKTRALLQLPVFDVAIYGTVRFHHRSVREFLTAKWLCRLLREGKSPRAIEGLFFAERYGERVLIPSMRPILSWLLLYDDRIMEKAVQIAPEVLIQGGDPSSLPFLVRKSAIEKYCKGYAHHVNGWFSFDMAELRRFSSRDLAETIRQLLVSYRDNDNICQLLLDMIWQGDIVDCSEEALTFALDRSRDRYTRICAVRALGAVRKSEQRKGLVKSFIAEFNTPNDGRLIGELIDVVSPAEISVQDVLLLLKFVEIDPEQGYLNTSLDLRLKKILSNTWTALEVAEFVNGAVLLLKEPPFIERRYFEISNRYCWLLPFAFQAVERMIKCKDQNVFNESMLFVLSIAPETGNFCRYFHTEKHSLAELVPQWPELNRALFWFDVSFLRKKLTDESKRLTDGWPLVVRGHYWRFTAQDFDYFIEAVRLESCFDDRLVALYEAFEIYRVNGRVPKQRKQLKESVRGFADLEERLASYLHPPPMPADVKKIRRTSRSFEKKQADRDKKEAAGRQKWRLWLQANPAVLRDTSIASAGKVWNATNYLLHEIWDKQESHNQWARADWKMLILEFGQDVAEAYRDGCIGYWRKYSPKIQSEENEYQNSTPTAVIIGLSGLMMEFQAAPDWHQRLSDGEAELASRYAVEELNGFPIWLQGLHAAFPDVVEERILAEIEWEFARFNGDAPCHYVLDDVNWQADWLKPKISHAILSFLKQYEPRHDDTVKKALEVVLSNGTLDKDSFIAIARAKIGAQISNERKAVWIAAWMGIDSETAFKELKVFLEGIADAESATAAAMVFLTELLGSRRERVNRIYDDYKRPSTLLLLNRLMHIYIKSSDDIHRKGVYSPGLRDDAQDARERLLQFLREVPGKEAYLGLLELANEQPNENMRDWYAGVARRRAELDAELPMWRSVDIKLFSDEAEKCPSTHRELFDLMVTRLSDLKDELENGANSNAVTFQDVQEERKHRIYIGGWLQDHNSGLYGVSPETELADRTKPDLYVSSNGILGHVPIELKVANNWTVKDLEDALKTQLCGQYLRDIAVNFGIYLLVYLGQKQWEDPDTRKGIDFNQLINRLEILAEEIVKKDRKIEALKVIGIDLAKRMKPVAVASS